MTTFKSILRRLSSSARAEREIEDELRFHIEMRTRDSVAAGLAPEEAVADALRRFGDYDRVKAMCREISEERRARMNSKTIKGIIWAMLGCGLTLRLTSEIRTLAQVGDVLIWIAVLWRLLIHLRATAPEQQRIEAAGQVRLSIVESTSDPSIAERPVTRIPAHDQHGRTPVERLLSDEEEAS
ncbi:MAG: permease prefix domain 1-containing protein [Blastocatellia bacterium]